MGHVVVTGVAGSLGRRVASRLAVAPGVERVVGLDSSEHEPPPGIEMHVLDLAGPPADVVGRLSGLVAGADGVIHLAWRTDDGRDRGVADAANHLGLQRVTDALATGGGRLVHLSSATVYGAWPDNPVPLAEDEPLRPNSGLAFAVGKADAERHLADFVERDPARAVALLRPAATVGSPDQRLYRALSGTASPRADDAVRPVQFLHVDDLASAVVWAWTEGLRGAFNVAPDRGTREDTARAITGGLARLRLPAPLARAVAAAGWRLGRTGVPAGARPYATYPWIVAPDKLLATGWSPAYSSEEALVATDQRRHWDDLPPGTRQNYTLLAAAGSVLALAGGSTAGVWALLRRRQSDSG